MAENGFTVRPNGFTVRPVMIILAAGLASRLGGQSKPGLPWRGASLAQHQRDTAEAAGFDVLTVVRAWGPDQGWIVCNPAPEAGQSASLQCGLSEVRRQRGPVPVGVLLVDQPFVTPEDVCRVWEVFSHRGPSVHAVRPRYGGKPGHPVIFDPHVDEAVMRLAGDRGLGAIWSHRADGLWVDIGVEGRPSPAFDIDTPEAYEQALAWDR